MAGIATSTLIATILIVTTFSSYGAQAAPAGDADLARMLPAETVALLRVQGLGAFWNRLKQSPLRERVEHADIPEIPERLAEVVNGLAMFEAQYGINLEQTLLTVLGTDFALALLPDDTGVFVARGDDPDAFEFAVDTILGIEEAQGRILRAGTSTHRGVTVHSVQVLRPDDPGRPAGERHYAFHNGAVIVSRSLETLKRAMDSATGAAPTLESSERYRRARSLVRPGSLATIYADLQRLRTTDIAARLAHNDLKNPVLRLWREGLRHNLGFADHLVVNVGASDRAWTIASTLAYDEGRMPSGLKDILPQGRSEIKAADLVPDEAVLAFANRSDKAALWAFAMQRLGESDPALAARATAVAQQVAAMFAGMDFEKEFLARLGEEGCLFVLPGAEGEPPAVGLLIELNDGDTLPQTLRTWIGTLAAVNQMEARKKHQPPQFAVARSSHRGVDATTLKVLRGDLAGKIAPSVAVVGRYMVVASNDAVIRRVADMASHERAASGSPIEGALFTRGYLDAFADCAR